MANVSSGVTTEIGIGIEVNENEPVKAQKKLEYRSGGLDRDLQHLYSRALRNSPTMRKKVVAGRAIYEGTIEVEITPEGGFPILMLGAMPVTTSTLSAPTRYRHRFANKFGSKSLTIIQRKNVAGSDVFFVYSGCRVNSIEIGVAKTGDDVLVARCGIVGLDERVYPVALVATAEADLGMDTAGFDTLPPYSPVDAVSSVVGVTAGLRSFSVNMARNVGRKDVLNGKRGAVGFFEQLQDVTGEITQYFDTLEDLERYMGVVDPTGAYGASKAIITGEAKVTVDPPANGAGIVNELLLDWPVADFQRVTEPVADANEITQTGTIAPLFDATSGTDFYMEIVNAIPNATLIAAGTPIVEVPGTEVSTYSATAG